MTPEGLKRDAEVVPEQSIAQRTGQRMDRLILLGLTVLIALVAGDWWSRESASESVTAPAAATKQAEAGDVANVKRRLAVLPLANFSPDPSDAFFADGLHDDLLTALSVLPGVELVSRTTMQTFKGSPKKLAEIAQEIGATQVLEGSVRRDETNVRLTVQLIDAHTDNHLWAQTFERPIAEAMSLQNDVAQGVARTMGLALGNISDAMPQTAVPAAYDRFLKARLSPNVEDRLRLLDAALLLDPGYAAARAQRSLAASQVLWFDDRQAAVLVAQARSDIERARKDRPGLALAEVADAVYSYYVDRDYPTALAKVGRVLERVVASIAELARGGADALRRAPLIHSKEVGRCNPRRAVRLSPPGWSRVSPATRDRLVHDEARAPLNPIGSACLVCSSSAPIGYNDLQGAR